MVAGARRPAYLLILLLLAAGAALALRTALAADHAARRPAAAALWPASGNGLVALVLERAAAADGVIDARSRSLIEQAMARIPAAGAPLALAGLDASAGGDLPKATRLMEAARVRAPRLVLVRGWLLNEYARTGRYAQALAEAGPVMRLAPESRPQVYALIAAIAGRADGAAAVRRSLAANPDWRGPYEAWFASR